MRCNPGCGLVWMRELRSVTSLTRCSSGYGQLLLHYMRTWQAVRSHGWCAGAGTILRRQTELQLLRTGSLGPLCKRKRQVRGVVP